MKKIVVALLACALALSIVDSAAAQKPERKPGLKPRGPGLDRERGPGKHSRISPVKVPGGAHIFNGADSEAGG